MKMTIILTQKAQTAQTANLVPENLYLKNCILHQTLKQITEVMILRMEELEIQWTAGRKQM
jgi:hypothetical protein